MWMFVIAFLLRALLILYGVWHDSAFTLKFTDVDYHVFTGAAAFAYNGTSPYQELTYKYTPLLSIILMPNVFLHPCFGKVLFSIFDIINGFLCQCMLLHSGHDSETVKRSVCILLLLNPMTAVISTRGNAESVQNFFVLVALYFVQRKLNVLGALLLGFAVHFKVYPIIFVVPLLLHISGYFSARRSKRQKVELTLASLVSLVYNKDVWIFALVSAACFVAVGAAMYTWLGYEFLQGTYLYHFSRIDTQHNFSPYFYPLSIVSNNAALRGMLSIAAFLPQAFAVLYYGVKFASCLPVAMFLQCFAFVSFNKVCTSQYFLWYLGLLPLAAPSFALGRRMVLKLVSMWIGAQALWLGLAYLLEFRGYEIMVLVWMASVAFCCVNIVILMQLDSAYCDSKTSKCKMH